MEAIMTLYRATNENAVAGFETVKGPGDVEIVHKAAPILWKRIYGKTLTEAIYILTSSGWDIERIKPSTT